MIIAHASQDVVPPSQLRPEIPADLEAIVLRCLAKRPADRYQDVASLAVALAECSVGRPMEPRAGGRMVAERADRAGRRAGPTARQAEPRESGLTAPGMAVGNWPSTGLCRRNAARATSRLPAAAAQPIIRLLADVESRCAPGRRSDCEPPELHGF